MKLDTSLGVEMYLRILLALRITASLLHTDLAWGRWTTVGCSSDPPTSNLRCNCNHTEYQNRTIYMDCEATNKEVKASWWKRNQSSFLCFESTQGGWSNNFVHKNYSLELRNLSVEDNGMYVCTYLDNTIASHCLTVIVPSLKITINAEDSLGTLYALCGQTYEIKCIAFGTVLPVSLTWTYNIGTNNSDEGMTFADNTTTVTSLRFISRTIGSGAINCSTTGGYPENKLMATVNVETYEIFVTVNDEKSNGTLFAVLHQKYHFKCIARGAYPMVNLSWTSKNYTVNQYSQPNSSCNDGPFCQFISFWYIANETGSNNISCINTGMNEYTVHVQVYGTYPAETTTGTVQVKADVSLWTHWLFWPGIGVFVVLSLTTLLVARCKFRKKSSENYTAYRGFRLASKASTFESLRKRESGSVPLVEMNHEDEAFGNLETIHEVTREDVLTMTSLSSRSFLEYFKGDYRRDAKHGHVLVKTVKESANVKDLYTFVKCSRIMESLPSHENVVAILGMSNESMPVYSYHEYVESITLRDYMLQNYQPSGVSSMSLSSRNACESNESNTAIELYAFSESVANAMSFLTLQKFTHPALSLRKVLLSFNGQCKLYDIWPNAMSSERIRSLLKREDPPLQWIAPECLFLGQYHPNTDVWSYGVLLWELFSFGETPFKNMSASEIESEVRNSRNLPMPPDCPGVIFSMMLSSWDKDSEKRLTFDQILQRLYCLLKSIAEGHQTQREVDVNYEWNLQYHKYFTLEGQSSGK